MVRWMVAARRPVAAASTLAARPVEAISSTCSPEAMAASVIQRRR